MSPRPAPPMRSETKNNLAYRCTTAAQAMADLMVAFDYASETAFETEMGNLLYELDNQMATIETLSKRLRTLGRKIHAVELRREDTSVSGP